MIQKVSQIKTPNDSKGSQKKKKVCIAAFKCIVMDRFPPPATVHSALQELSSGQCRSLYLSLIHRMIAKVTEVFLSAWD